MYHAMNTQVNPVAAGALTGGLFKAGAGVRGMGNVFKEIPKKFGVGSFFAAENATGFNATMNRTEAAKILGVRCARAV